jgi:hypothetical protein
MYGASALSLMMVVTHRPVAFGIARLLSRFQLQWLASTTAGFGGDVREEEWTDGDGGQRCYPC